MSTNAYDIGDIVRLSAVFKDAAGAVIDPTAATLKVARPDGTVDTATWPSGTTVLTRDDVGTFHFDYALTGGAAQAGFFEARWEGTGTAQAAEQARFYARPKNVA